ncbi:hypothetical protein M0P65_02210 [Candidatus Gracilibacteria bacterium]|nr:hypothetical protein [Candidatus Gracilibacteria bacterium]
METKSMLYENNKKSMYASALLILAVIIAFFFTKNLYTDNIEAKTNLELSNSQASELKNKLDELTSIKDNITKDEKTKKDISWFGSSFREDKIIDSIFGSKEGVAINDISIEKGSKLPNGLMMGDISLNIEASKVDVLNKYLKYLSSDQNNIKYVIKSVNFPFDSRTDLPITASINLGMYYFAK